MENKAKILIKKLFCTLKCLFLLERNNNCCTESKWRFLWKFLDVFHRKQFHKRSQQDLKLCSDLSSKVWGLSVNSSISSMTFSLPFYSSYNNCPSYPLLFLRSSLILREVHTGEFILKWNSVVSPDEPWKSNFDKIREVCRPVVSVIFNLRTITLSELQQRERSWGRDGWISCKPPAWVSCLAVFSS